MPHKQVSRAHRAAAMTAIGLFAAGALSACTSQTAASDTTATLWALTGDQAIVEPAVDRWNEDHPDQQIEAQFFANDAYKSKIKTSVGAGSAPTLIYSWAGGTLESYVNSDKVVDLTDATADIAEKYNESVWDLGVIDGKTYAVPMDPSYPIVLYYNKEVLKDAGVEAPSTYEDVLDAVPALLDNGVLPFSLAGGSKWPQLMWEEYFVDRIAGPEAFQAVLDGDEGAWSDPGIIEANETLVDLVDRGAFGDSFNSVVADNNADIALLYTGKAAMLLQGAWAYGTFASEAPDFTDSSLGYTAFPAVENGAGDAANIVGNVSGYFSVSADASESQQDTAIDFLTNGVFDDEYTQNLLDNGQVPPLAGVADEIEGGSDSFLGTVADMIEAAPNFEMSWDQALPSAQSTALLENLDKLFSGTLTPEEFSDAMDKTVGK